MNFIEFIKKKVEYIARAFNLGYSEKFDMLLTINNEEKSCLFKIVHSIFNESPIKNISQSFIDYKEIRNHINYGVPRDETKFNKPSQYESYLQNESVHLILSLGNFKIKELIPTNCNYYTHYDIRNHYSDNQDWYEYCERARSGIR